MAQLKLTLSANAGGVLELGEHRLWIDALHNQKVLGFSTLDGNLQGKMLQNPNFQNPELIAFTHCHPDHFSQELTQKAMELWPETEVFLPESHFSSQVLLTGHEYTWEREDLQLRFLALTHEGVQYANTHHYGLLIAWQGMHILIPGDCQVADSALSGMLQSVEIDLAILNFPWLTLKKGRGYLEQVMKPKQAIFWHLPFGADDTNSFRPSAEAALKQYRGNGVLLADPLRTLELHI
ncbi:MAG: hypothetical protein E7439_01930 [Ruminococcaceae bacterium]|nr:hypothetical protein [Oscillospiraceae bacterium]